MTSEAERFSPTTVRAMEPAGVDQVRVTLEAPPGFLDAHTRAGQYCELRTPDGQSAPYALLSAPHERALVFLVKATSEPGLTLARLRVSDRVDATPPGGPGFDLEGARGADLVFVATGTGIAPVRAAIETVLLEAARFGALALYYGVRDDRFVSVEKALARWERAGVLTRVHHSRPTDTSESGAYVQELVARDAPDPARVRFVVAGHDALVEALTGYVRDHGGDERHVLVNY